MPCIHLYFSTIIKLSGSTFASQRNIELAESTEMALHSDLAKLREMHFPPPSTMENSEKMES